MASRTDRFIDGKFFVRINPKDGYAVSECNETRAKKVFEFLVPLLYPKKPTRVTITMGNTIFGALSKERPIDWGQVIKDVVQRQFFGMANPRQLQVAPMSFTCTTPMKSYFQLRRRSTKLRKFVSNIMSS